MGVQGCAAVAHVLPADADATPDVGVGQGVVVLTPFLQVVVQTAFATPASRLAVVPAEPLATIRAARASLLDLRIGDTVYSTSTTYYKVQADKFCC